jgi:hypothetical protein
MSSPESMVHREQDFDYEVIEAGSGHQYQGGNFMQTQLPVDDEEISISVADHYKGTPPLRSKKKPKSRYSHEIPADFQVRLLKCDFFFNNTLATVIPPVILCTTTYLTDKRGMIFILEKNTYFYSAWIC